MTIKEISNYIKTLNPNIDSKTLEYLTNYFYVALKRKVIPTSVSLDKLIKNTLNFVNRIEFYNENYQVYKNDVNGFIDYSSKTLYIRDNLDEPLKEMVIYHEIHHAAQTNPLNFEVGINQESNIGRLIMEAQTEYIAEEIYKTIHNIEYEERIIPTSNLRMKDGGVVISSLQIYELYDNLLTKLAIIMDVPKDYFVSINYLYNNNWGLKVLEERYKLVQDKYQLSYSFRQLLLYLDYIYCVDYISYKDNPDKELLLKGGVTKKYEIHPRQYLPLSLVNEQVYLAQLDGNIFLALVEFDGNYRDFAKYIVDNKQRDIAQEYIEMVDKELEK